MRVVHVSDTHMSHWQLEMPDGDILVHTGDFSGRTTDNELFSFNNWLGELKEKYKKIFFVPGNHDGQFENYYHASTILSNAEVLFDRMLEYEGFKIYGSPWTCEFFDWHFMKPREKMHEAWDKIPDDIDILLVHQPPYMFLDHARDINNSKKIINVGCKSLYETCLNRLKNLKLCAFGHLHMDGGQMVVHNNCVYSNGAVLNDYYTMKNGPNVIDL